MADYLPRELRHLLTDGVTPLGRPHEIPDRLRDREWAVKVRVSGGRGGQWVGSYSRTDALTVARAIAAASPGAIVGERAQIVYVTLRTSVMSPAEFLSILEATGHAAEEDAARALGMSRSMIQKMKTGSAPVRSGTAEAVRGLLDDYLDAREAALDAGAETVEVWRDNEESWSVTGRPARWHRMIAAECVADGAAVVYTGA